MTDDHTAEHEVDLDDLAEIDEHILFYPEDQVMEVRLGQVHFHNTADVNRFYDRVEDRIAETGEPKWFFLIDYSGVYIDPGSWVAYSRRGKALNEAHSMHTVRFDASDINRRQIERAAGTESFDPNLFADREAAFARLRSLTSTRVKRADHTLSFSRDDLDGRLTFRPEDDILDIDFHGIELAHSEDVDLFYDYLTEEIETTGRKWYFLIDYADFRIMSGAWVRYAARGKRLNEAWSLGSVRYAPGSETETDIRLRAESQGFRPNIRNTREEALERIEELRAEYGKE